VVTGIVAAARRLISRERRVCASILLATAMAQVLVRELDPETVERLKERAARHGRSLEAELRLILERAATRDAAQAAVLAAKIRRRLKGRTHTDSALLVAEDRER
jgi:antitoxin FitA